MQALECIFWDGEKIHSFEDHLSGKSFSDAFTFYGPMTDHGCEFCKQLLIRLCNEQLAIGNLKLA